MTAYDEDRPAQHPPVHFHHASQQTARSLCSTAETTAHRVLGTWIHLASTSGQARLLGDPVIGASSVLDQSGAFRWRSSAPRGVAWLGVTWLGVA